MEINTNHFITQKTARYSTLGTLSKETKYFWFALHGSKMQCEQVLYKFAKFDPKEHFIVAPEGLNRFYANGFGGEVVSSWMTSRDRLAEIDDFSIYLSNLYQKYIDLIPNHSKKILLAFSQGCTTAYRWMNHSRIEADYFLPYSGWIPEDIDLKNSKTNLNKIKTTYSYGSDDQFLTPEIIEKIKKNIDKNDLEITIEKYKGDHRIDKTHLQYLFKNYINI
ncbi:alpha/beta hydrolase [Portibacter lacus]|nr:hypothetical protein [Portibacter lacus]